MRGGGVKGDEISGWRRAASGAEHSLSFLGFSLLVSVKRGQVRGVMVSEVQVCPCTSVSMCVWAIVLCAVSEPRKSPTIP